MKSIKFFKNFSSKTIYILVSVTLILSIGLYFSFKKYSEPKFRIQPVENVPSTNQSKNKIINNDIVFNKIISKDWFWVETIIESSVGIKPYNLTAFKLTLSRDLTFKSTSDCNSLGGNYEIFENKIKFKDIVRSEKYCMKSRETEFIEGLSNVSEIMFNEKNELILKYKDSTTMMRFK
jgi:heat shock protein HslJ